MSSTKFAYEEPKKALNSRIAAHAKYSSFNLHEWLKEQFKIESGQRILDLGCGNGNYTSLFWECVQPDGFILGLDKNSDLIEEAQATHKDLSDRHVQFSVHDYDRPFPNMEQGFDWIFAIYSLYYTEDSLKLVDVIKNLLNPGGAFVVIGPGPANVKDLIEFNFQMTNVQPNDEFVGRIERIAHEFKPIFDKTFEAQNVQYEEINSIMEFPTAETYAEYYWSTLLWRESTEGLSDQALEELKQDVVRKVSVSLPAQIKKQMSCLVGRADKRKP